MTEKIVLSFVAKRIITSIWQSTEDKVKRDSLLDYHSLRRHVVSSSKYILSEEQEVSTRIETGAGPCSSSRHLPEEVENARHILARLRSEDQRGATGEDDGSQENVHPNNDWENEPEPDKYTEQVQVPNPAEADNNHYIIPELAEAEIRSIEEVDNLQRCEPLDDCNVIKRVRDTNTQNQARKTSHTAANIAR